MTASSSSGSSSGPRILIVDDEAPARTRLRQLLADVAVDYPHQVVGEAANPQSVLDLLAETPADIALLDMQMPGMSGIELARHLGALPQPPAIIFITAFDEYAVKAFEVHALDYLLKPVRAQRLLDALKRVALSPSQKDALTAISSAQGSREHISVHERGRILLVPVSTILYLKAEQKYVTLRTSEREYLLEESLVALEEEFSKIFVRIHRNALVARAAIKGFERAETVVADDSTTEPHWEVILQGLNERLLVSRRQWPVIKQHVR